MYLGVSAFVSVFVRRANRAHEKTKKKMGADLTWDELIFDMEDLLHDGPRSQQQQQPEPVFEARATGFSRRVQVSTKASTGPDDVYARAIREAFLKCERPRRGRVSLLDTEEDDDDILRLESLFAPLFDDSFDYKEDPKITRALVRARVPAQFMEAVHRQWCGRDAPKQTAPWSFQWYDCVLRSAHYQCTGCNEQVRFCDMRWCSASQWSVKRGAFTVRWNGWHSIPKEPLPVISPLLPLDRTVQSLFVARPSSVLFFGDSFHIRPGFRGTGRLPIPVVIFRFHVDSYDSFLRNRHVVVPIEYGMLVDLPAGTTPVIDVHALFVRDILPLVVWTDPEWGQQEPLSIYIGDPADTNVLRQCFIPFTIVARGAIGVDQPVWPTTATAATTAR